jgi:hypothetical protein
MVPLRASPDELSIRLPSGAAGEEAGGDSEGSAVQLEGKISTRHESTGATTLVISSQKIKGSGGIPCRDDLTGTSSYEYATTEDGLPVSEFISVDCGGESVPFIGVLYHEVGFLDASQVAEDMFDVDSTRSSLVEKGLSSAAAQLGGMFWLGEQVDTWRLDGAEHEAGSASVYYSRGDGDSRETVELRIRAPSLGYGCENPEPIPNDPYGGSLCHFDETPNEYRVVLKPPGFDVILEKQGYPEEIARDDILELARAIQPWDDEATGPLLTNQDVRNLVADSLELVCPSKVIQIRESRSQASFTFNRSTGEWTGTFGSFGEVAVPDSKPVAIPVSNREAVDSTLSHNGAQFFDCTIDEQPPAEEGDGEFGVEFLGSDDAGFSFQVTGMDSQTEAALTFCLLPDSESCGLTDPQGTKVDFRGITINSVRPQVIEVQLGVPPDARGREGVWTMTLDLGDGEVASTTFEIP